MRNSGSEKLINWGILSTGRIANKFCEDVKFVSNGRIHAVAARDLTDAKQFAERFNITAHYEGYDLLFNDPDVDIIYIGTPHNFHFEQTKQALLAGKSVLCEKPITISPDELIQLELIAKEKGLFLMEAMWTYFLPAIKQAKLWVSEGRIGKLIHIKASLGHAVPFDPQGRMYNPELAGGCLLDMGIYPLSIAQYFCNAPLEKLSVLAKHAKTGVDDDLNLIARSGEVSVSLSTSFRCRLPNSALIIGEKGTIEIPRFWQAKSCELKLLDDTKDEFLDTTTSWGYCHEAEAVGEAILSGKTEHPLMPLTASMSLQRSMEGILKLINFSS